MSSKLFLKIYKGEFIKFTFWIWTWAWELYLISCFVLSLGGLAKGLSIRDWFGDRRFGEWSYIRDPSVFGRQHAWGWIS